MVTKQWQKLEKKKTIVIMETMITVNKRIMKWIITMITREKNKNKVIITKCVKGFTYMYHKIEIHIIT